MDYKAIGAAASALICCLGNPADAAWVNQHGVTILEGSDFPISHRPLFNALQDAGIGVVDAGDWEYCEPTESKYVAGFYSPSRNFIGLCTNSDAPDLLNTFTHEAVHAVQDCRSGLNNPQMGAVVKQHYIDSLPKSEIEIITTLYPEDQWDDEVEARYFADSPKAVTEGVRMFCF